MISTTHLLKVAAAWTSIVYVVCFLGVLLAPGVRSQFMMYGLHMRDGFGTNVFTLGTFISGFVIWNVIAVLAVWLFAALFNGIKK